MVISEIHCVTVFIRTSYNCYAVIVLMQQLANMTLEGNRERRYFTAVAGDRSQKGELFGYNNLFPLRKPGQPGLNLTLDILKVTVEISL